MVAAGMFILKSLFNGTWSWGGFARSLLLGAVTGAGTGGMTALITGQNFLESIVKGAVICCGVAGISYTVNYFMTNNTTSYMDASDKNIIDNGTPVGKRSYARDLYEKFGVQDGLNKNSIYNDASRLGGKMNADGVIEYTYKGKITKALGVTDVKLDKYGKRVGKIRMYLSNKAFASREQLAYVMQHELNHVRIANAGLSNIAEQSIKLTSKIAQKYSDLLDNVGHYHIQESGSNFLENNGWHNIQSTVPSEVFNSLNFQMGNERIWKLLQGTDKKININFK